MGSCPFGIALVIRLPTWGLPSCGHVQGLVAEFAGIEEVPWSGPVALARLLGLVGGAGVLRGWRILGSFKRVRLHRENPAGRGEEIEG